MKKNCITLLAIILIVFNSSLAISFQKAYDPFYTEHQDYAGGRGYAYAPSTVYYQGTFYQFYCSSGEGTADHYYHPDLGAVHHSWDHIRLRTSKNGSTWSGPKTVLTVTKHYFSGNNERCTCDPSVVQGDDGYWYMMYDGNLEYHGTVIYLARSKSLFGPYEKYTENGTWELFPDKPKPIVKYSKSGSFYKPNDTRHSNLFVVSPNKKDTIEVYGVGQQSVVYQGGYYHVWFNDMTVRFDSNNNIYRYVRYAKVKKLTDLKFDNNSLNSGATPFRAVTIDGAQKHYGMGNGDIKWNPKSKRFEMWTMEGVCQNMDSYGHCFDDISGEPHSFKFVKYNSNGEDGSKWTKDTSFDLGGPYRFIHNPGVSGDEKGWIKDNRYLLSFSAPKKMGNYSNVVVSGYTIGCPESSCAFAVGNGVWPMYQTLVNTDGTAQSWGSYSVKINNGAKLDSIPAIPIYFADDFDGDGITDIGVYNKQNGNTYIVYSRKNKGYKGSVLKTEKRTFANYSTSHKLITGDFDGDGKADRGMYKYGTPHSAWYIYSSKDNGNTGINTVTNDANGLGNIPWGWQWAYMQSMHTVLSGGDYDGDGITDRAIINNSSGEWYILSSRYHDFLNYSELTGGYYNQTIWGWKWNRMNSSYTPVVGDFDGDGITDRAMVNKSSGRWYIIGSRSQDSSAYINFFREVNDPTQKMYNYYQKGVSSSSVLAIADYDGDGVDDLASVIPSKGTWRIRYSTTAADSNTTWKPISDMSNITVLPGDYDGDGKADLAFVDLKTNKIYVKSLQSSSSGISTTIHTACSLYNSSYLSKEAPYVAKEESVETVPATFEISHNAGKLSISGLSGREKIVVANVMGKVVYNSIGQRGSVNVQLPSAGRYVVKVGATTKIISYK